MEVLKVFKKVKSLFESSNLNNHLRQKILIFLFSLFSFTVTAQIVYVDANVSGGAADGSSWANAFPNLQDALSTATAGQEIQIAQGTYYPDVGGGQTDNDRSASFFLVDGVSLTGGFPTGGGVRDVLANPTILSGDIDQNTDPSTVTGSFPGLTFNGFAGNSLVVVYSINISSTSLDGLIIEHASFNGFSGAGVGLYVRRNIAGTSVANIKNCIFRENQTDSNSPGSALNLVAGAVSEEMQINIENCLFYRNMATDNTGPALRTSLRGANSFINVLSSTFTQNEATGGSFNVGAIAHDGTTSGGASAAIPMTISNTIIWNNEGGSGTAVDVSGYFGGFDNGLAEVILQYSILPVGGVENQDISPPAFTQTAMLNSDPLFTDAGTNNYTLQSGSPAIDAGNNALNSATFDLAGNNRIFNSTVDMGTFEFVPTPPPTVTFFSPTNGPVGTPVTITGTGFNPTPSNNSIYFGAIKVTPSAGSATTLNATIPPGTTSIAPVVVQNNTTGLQASSLNSTTPLYTLTNSPTLATLNYASSSFSVSGQSQSLTVADFNNDGNMDVATANTSSDNVSIRLGDGLGGFSSQADVAVGDQPYSVAVADFDNDGVLDMAIPNLGSDNVSIRLGNGNGTFSTAANVAAQSEPRSIAIGDFNGDGNIDLAVQNNFPGNSISIRLGNGDGTFSGTNNIPVTGSPLSVVSGDFNNDLVLDLAVTGVGGDVVRILLGDGIGGFSVTNSVSVGDQPFSTSIADFNGDGNIDLATANSNDNTVSISLGNGSGAFTVSATVNVGDSPREVAIGDFNGDGNMDFASSNRNSGNISIRLGDGAGNFSGTTDVPAGSNPNAIKVGDFNNDGRADLIAPNIIGSAVTVLLYEDPFVPFITTWQATDGTITIPTFGGGYNYDITWTNLTNSGIGDGSDASLTGDYTIIGLNSPDIYQVEITGAFPAISFNDPSQSNPNSAKILTIEQWGDIAWQSMESAFRGCSNLTYNAVDIPDLSGVSSLQRMFENATSFNGDLGGWDVSTITTMRSMFDGATTFNQDISGWTVSLVSDFHRMFAGATNYNSPLDTWDVSGAIDMSGMFSFMPNFNQSLDGWGNKLNGVSTMQGMFQQTDAFNQDLNNWDVSTVQNFDRMFIATDLFNGNISNWTLTAAEDMSQMFLGTLAFNSDITGWDVSNVTNMSGMFAFADVFNQDIGAWDVSNVTDMGKSPGGAFEDGMFSNAIAFDQDLGSWNIGNVLDMEEMLDNSGMSTANYEATLLGWGTIDGGAGETAIPSSITLGALGLNYCDPTGRDLLTAAPNNWTIIDAGPTVDPTAMPIASQFNVCNGGSFDFSIGANVQAAYIYKLYSGFTDLTNRGNEIGTWTEGTAPTPITIIDGVNGIVFGDNILNVVGEDAGLSCENILDETLTITLNELPTGAIAGDAVFCEGASSGLTFTLTGIGPYDVTYNDGSGDVSLTGISNGHLETVSPTTTTTYTLVSVTDANGCIATDLTGSATITVNPLPTVAIAGDATICEGASTNLTFTLTGTGPFDVTYNDGSTDVVLSGIDNGHTVTVTPTATTIYTLVSASNNNGCLATDLTSSATITVNPLPTVAIAGDATICEGASTDLTFTLTGTGPYDVTYNDGNADVVLNGISNGYLETVSPTTTTTYTLVSAADANGCAATAISGSSTITVNPLPTITIDAQDPFCVSNAAATLVATPSGGTWEGTGITDGTAGTFDPATAGVGTFTITYTVTELGCTNAETIDITVLETPDASINAAGPFCSADAPVTLSALNTGGTWSGTGITDAAAGIFNPAGASIGDNVITYTLEIRGCQDIQTTTIVVNETSQLSIDAVEPICLGGTPITLTSTPNGGRWSGSGITDATAGTFDPEVAGLGTSLVIYTVSVDGCSSFSEITVEVLATPEAANQIIGPNNFCSGDEVIYTTSIINGADTYQWETPSGSVSTDTPELTYIAQESGQIAVAGVNSCGTGIAANFSYTLAPSVTASFDFSISPLSDLEYQFTNTSTAEVNTWTWDFGDGTTSNMENPTHTYELPGQYSVSLTASNGPCEDIVSQTINVSTEIIINIGNIITANNNGQNDFIYIENIEKYEDHTVQLLNRWGKVVFSSTNFSNTPGSVSNKPELESGNYVCIVIIRFAGMEVKQQQLITVVK